jgi:hypothetical protein
VTRSTVGATAAALMLIGSLTGCSITAPQTVLEEQPFVVSAVDAERVARMLSEIPDRDADPELPYDRVADFGPAWADVDGNGCSTRDDILARDLVDVVTRDGCTVLTGTLDDPYTGQRIAFHRGVDTSLLVQVDHVVPLAYAWSHGAAAWTAEKRQMFANDPRVLLAVDGTANQAKGAAGPSTWMPSNAGYTCAYVDQFVTILHDNQLTIDPTDRAANTAILTAY